MLKRVLRQIAGLIPQKLPVGISQFDTWSESIINTYPMPTADVESIKFALASILMHMGPQVVYKPKLYFYLTVTAGAVKQTAGQVFYDIKTKQKEAEIAAKKALDESQRVQEASKALV